MLVRTFVQRALIALAMLVGSAPLSGQAAQPPDQVKAEFAAICERESTQSEFFGSQPLARSREQTRAQTDDPGLQLALADDAVRLGDFDRAVALTKTAQSSLESQSALALEATKLEALAHFFEAEDNNCLNYTHAASCILPIRPEAVHRDRESINKAIVALRRWQTLDPEDSEARWLLNLAHMLAGDYPDALPEEALISLATALNTRAQERSARLPRMHNVAPTLGVDSRDHAGGAIMDDFDGDGLLDLISSSWSPCAPLRAFRSNGKGGFDDVSELWGLDRQLGGLNLVHADVNNDGRLDLLVLRGAWAGREGQIRNSLLLNRIDKGIGFADVTYAVGLAQPAAPTQAAAFADFDLDGDLDLYIGNESAIGGTAVQAFDPTKGRTYPSQLFENTSTDGTLRFRNIARAAGVENRRFAKGVAWGDIDNDGDPDLFVSNIGANRLYLNQGDGRFSDVAEQWGVSDPSRSFAAWFFDFDNDGDLDLFNADYSAPTAAIAASLAGDPNQNGHPRLYRNDGDRFTDVSVAAGFDRPALPMGANFGDIDGDGLLDIMLGTGVPDYTAVHPNLVFRNVDGIRFADATASSGMGHLQKGHAVAFGDLDHDGDLDVFEQLGGAFPYDAYGNALYLNPMNSAAASSASGTRTTDEPGGHRFLTLELRGSSANSFAVGARIALTVQAAPSSEIHLDDMEATRTIHRSVSSGGSFGGSSLRQTIGLGAASKLISIEIRWPDGSAPIKLSGNNFQLDSAYRITQATSDPASRIHIEALSLQQVSFLPRSQSPSDHDHH